jgi:hypothetical protein
MHFLRHSIQICPKDMRMNPFPIDTFLMFGHFQEIFTFKYYVQILNNYFKPKKNITLKYVVSNMPCNVSNFKYLLS